MRLRPKILLDVKPSLNTDIYEGRSKRVNLSYTPKKHSYFLKTAAFIACAVILPALFFSSVLAPITGGTLAQTTGNNNTTTEQRQELLDELEKLEKQIAESEQIIDKYRQQGNSLQGEIKALNAKVSQLNLKIKAANLSLQKLDNEIALTSGKINVTENNISSNKLVITEILQNLYESDDQGLLEILIKNPKLSDFFNNVNDMATVQESMRVALQKYIVLKENLNNQKEELNLERADQADLKAYQDAQKKIIANTKTEKDTLLKVTKGKESEYQKLLVETKKTAAEIRSQIFKLLGGGELPFGDAVKIAQLAEKATDVRAAFILAILTQESSVNGVIGANLGKCYYNDVRKNSSGTVMSNSQKPAFLSIMSEIGMDPAKTLISCPIVSDGAYGGAMGPAQFMPTTWQLYDDEVAVITGNKPASPFNNADAFTATALYLQDGLIGCRSIYKTIFSQESCAAAKYYAGGNWRLYMSVGRYGYRVAERAADFADEIKILDAN